MTQQTINSVIGKIGTIGTILMLMAPMTMATAATDKHYHNSSLLKYGKGPIESRCPPKHFKPYHWYMGADVHLGFLQLPDFVYGSPAGSVNNSHRFNDSPTIEEYGPSSVLGYRTFNNPVWPAFFGERADYELRYRYNRGSKTISHRTNGLDVFPIDRAANPTTVTFPNNTLLSLDTLTRWHQFKMLLKSAWGSMRPSAGIDFRYLINNYDIPRVTDSSNNAFLLSERSQTLMIGPTFGLEYHKQFWSVFDWGITAMLSGYYYDTDLVGKQKFAGQFNQISDSEKGFSANIGLKGRVRYNFNFGNLAFFASAYDDPAFPTVRNAITNRHKTGIDHDNETIGFAGLELQLHMPDNSIPRVGKCLSGR